MQLTAYTTRWITLPLTASVCSWNWFLRSFLFLHLARWRDISEPDMSSMKWDVSIHLSFSEKESKRWFEAEFFFIHVVLWRNVCTQISKHLLWHPEEVVIFKTFTNRSFQSQTCCELNETNRFHWLVMASTMYVDRNWMISFFIIWNHWQRHFRV